LKKTAAYILQIIYLYIYGSIALVGLVHVFRGLARRKAATYTQNKSHIDSHARTEFEPTMPRFEREKTVHASDRAATVIGVLHIMGSG
jgi:hypothetical protein